MYDTLKAQIHDFQLVAGDRFSEAELGPRLGMSRTPVREALFRLRNEGFLGVESKLGWYVLPIDFGRSSSSTTCASCSSWPASRACAHAPSRRPSSRR